MRVLLTWSSLSKPGALPYPPSPAHGDWGSADPLKSSQRDKTLPRKPRSATHEPAEGEKGSDIEQDPMLWQPGLAETSWTGIGSGGLGGGGELGLGNDGSSGTKGSGGGRKTKITSWLIRRLGFLRHDHRCFVGIYFQHEQRHRRALWDSCHTAACHCTWWIYRSVTKKRKKKDTASHLGWFPVKFYKISSKGDKPLGGTVVLFSCGSTDMTQLPHIYWDLPTLHFASPQDMATLCGGKKQTICFNNWAPIEQQQ